MVRLQLAGISVQMNNRFPELDRLCRDYMTEEDPVIILSVTQAEIEEERSKQADIFTDGYLETICLYRKMALEMLNHNVFLMHASIIEVDGAGYAFLAPSGTGKTTQTRLWLEHFGDRARVINGDKPLIRLYSDESFAAFGTPWCGKEGMGCNAKVPIKALFLLERSTIPSCEPASQEVYIDRFFRQLLLPHREDLMDKQLQLADHFVELVPAYILRCDMTHASVLAAMNAVGLS